jgi:adenylate cyclase class 2
MNWRDQLRLQRAVTRQGAVSAVRADLVNGSWQIAGRAHGTGAHCPSLAEPLHLFYAFATQRGVSRRLNGGCQGERLHTMRSETPKRSKQVQLEIEVKIKIRNLRKLRGDLLELGCTETAPRSLERNWTWDFPGQSLRQQGKLLRVRQFAGHCLLTFKGAARQSRHFKIREERETVVRDRRVLDVILERLGLQVMFRYEKYRTAYSLRLRGKRGTVDLSVDETPIGNYLEIEGTEANIHGIAKKLGFEDDAFIKESYLALFAKSRSRNGQQDMVFARFVKSKARRV